MYCNKKDWKMESKLVEQFLREAKQLCSGIF
jgi:hypothetical protein